MSMQVLVQWCYSFIQLNKSNYSFFLSFHRMISTWMNSGCLLTSLEKKGNHHRGIGVKAISFQNPTQQTSFQLWPGLYISNTSTLKWYGNVYTITDYRCLHHTLLIKARTWNHFRNCFFISLSDWIWSILYFSKEVLWSWFPILVLPPENCWALGCLYHSLLLGPFTTRVVIPPCWQLALIPQGSSLLRDLMMVFLKGFKYHIKHDLRAIITQYHVFILDFTKAQSNHFASSKRMVSSQNQQQSHVPTLLESLSLSAHFFF